MKDPITIRPIREEDAPDWQRLWTAYLAFYETTLPKEIYETSFRRLLSGQPGEYRCLIAEMAGKPVGLAHFLFHRTMWAVENTCYLMDLYCDPGQRGQGVGRRLIDAVHAAAKAEGVPTTYWMTQEFNYKGRMLYDQVAVRTPFIVYEKDN